MTFPNINTKTTLDSQIIAGDRSICNMYATVESSGAYNINFNVTDATGWHENEASNIEDVKSFISNAQEVANKQFEANKVPEEES
ncbi:hypothetical protein [Lactococcus garvieae]|uniref:Uncharacterized protein n=1 Tax=Lactococcus garvieae DCC43 TaxID=1231377 RepID=K2PG65_9LACT|nr:hypothetical protein [Lactococcus garvieae]EKF50445.1 hypothetical protein C426_2225 [Lactococcus garvieae DCC43]